MVENNLERNDVKDSHCMKKECFQDISNESKILDVIGNEKINDFFCKMETSHPIKYYPSIEEECAYDVDNISKILELGCNENEDEHVLKDHSTND